MKHPIAVGDKVRYSAVWLRSTGQYTGDICFARGVVRELETLATRGGTRASRDGMTLATIDWDICNIPVKVNVKNLERVR